MVQGTSRGVGGTVQGRSGLERGSSREWDRGSREGLPPNFKPNDYLNFKSSKVYPD